MSYSVRRAIHSLLLLTTVLLALSVGYRHVIIGKLLTSYQSDIELIVMEMLPTHTNVMHCKPEEDG